MAARLVAAHPSRHAHAKSVRVPQDEAEERPTIRQRKRHMKSSPILAALAFALLATTTPVRAADVTYERLVNPEPHNWLMNHRDFASQRFSPLDAINKSNIKNMKLLFTVA